MNITQTFECILLFTFKTEVVTDKKDVKASKRKRQKFQGDSTLEEKTNDKNNPFDFYKFAEETAGTIKSEPENLENNCNKKFAPPPQWFNKRPKITYSTMCAMAIQVNSYQKFE
jgi:hypothetical protein